MALLMMNIMLVPWNGQTTLDPSSNCPNSYTPILTDYNSSAGNDSSLFDESSPLEVNKPVESRLDLRVNIFISHIFNDNMMVKQMAEIGYDANKSPLKLSKTTILKVLKSCYSALLYCNLEGTRKPDYQLLLLK